MQPNLAFILEVDRHDKRHGADQAIELSKGQTRLVKLYNALRIGHVWRLDNIPTLLVDDALAAILILALKTYRVWASA